MMQYEKEEDRKREENEKNFLNLPNEWRSSAQKMKLWLDPHSLSTFRSKHHNFIGDYENSSVLKYEYVVLRIFHYYKLFFIHI